MKFYCYRAFTRASMSELCLSPLAPPHLSPILLQQRAFCSLASCLLAAGTCPPKHPSRRCLCLRDSVLGVMTYSFKRLCRSLIPGACIKHFFKKKKKTLQGICKLHLWYKNIHCCCFMSGHGSADALEKEPKEGFVWKIKPNPVGSFLANVINPLL